MKKNLAIIDSCAVKYDFKTKVLGGSESWVVNMSREFSKHNFNVIVFNNNDSFSIDPDTGIMWAPLSLLDKMINMMHFDYVILQRIYEDVINKIRISGCTDNIIIQAHDTMIGYKGERYTTSVELHLNLVKFISCVSRFNCDMLVKNQGIPEDMLTVNTNGVNEEQFNLNKKVEVHDNNILWSSCEERGLPILTEYILPLVREEIPDCKVEVAGYNAVEYDLYKDRDDVILLGRLSKEDLYENMKKHKVWFYPSIFPETFNVTCLENLICRNIPVMPILNGEKTILHPWEHSLRMDNNFKVSQVWASANDNAYKEQFDKELNKKAIREAADKIIYIMKNYDDINIQNVLDDIQNLCLDEFSWKKVADKYVTKLQNIH